jgi:hypothetical protein
MEEIEEKVVSIRAPSLSALDRLYVRAYLSSLSHISAHRTTQPELKNHSNDNPFSRKESVQFHISLGLQEKAEALSISPEVILEKLFKEATREGPGSNHAARIQALTQLGKHLGLFKEKEESQAPIFNIISYGSSPEKIVIEESKEIQEVQETLPDNILISDYSNGTRIEELYE